MSSPEVPNEHQRLDALEATDLFSSPAEERFDRITRLASRLLDAPIALVTLVGETRQWIKSAQGLTGVDVDREVSFCAHAIASDGLVVEDATRDPRFAGNPFVTGDAHIRSYAGTVIRAPGGEPLGTLCIVDRKPRTFTADQLAVLADLAAIAESEVARMPSGVQAEYLHRLGHAERRERIDPHSRLLGHAAMVELLMQHAASGERPFSIILVRIPEVAGLIARLGPESGALAMAEVGSLLLRALPRGDVAGRYEHDTFIVVSPGAGDDAAFERAAGVRDSVAARPVKVGDLSFRLHANTAARTMNGGETTLAAVLESAADELR